ncbi:MAG: TrbI/VirB10 family protein [Holophagales bacterium]|nr:MAG: TrbI/VirB10 family protein [Holophagales bacterium]
METGTPPVEPKEAGLELTPQPRIKKLSSAIVWIAAIFAVAVLWLVGYLVSSKARRPNQDHRVASVPPPVEDLAERIQRAAEREAKVAAEQAAAERGRKLQTPADLPPGFEQLLAKRDQPLAAGPPAATYGHEQPPSGRGGTSPGRTELQRALDSDLVPVAFRSGGPRSGSSRADRTENELGDGAPAAPPDLASLRAELVRAVQAKVEPQPSAAPKPVAGALHPAGSPFRISAGTLIPAVLTAGINSDLPGQTTALVRRNVYDSQSGRFLLIPQGSRLVGEYDSRVAFGQKRVLVAWNRVIFPDGRSLDLAGMQGVDLAAAAGLRDRVDNHFVRTFGSALLLAAVSAGVQLSQPEENGGFGTNPTPSQLAAAAVGQELGRVATEYLRRNLDVRPTIEVRPGYELNVEVTSDLDLPFPYEQTADAR